MCKSSTTFLPFSYSFSLPLSNSFSLLLFLPLSFCLLLPFSLCLFVCFSLSVLRSFPIWPDLLQSRPARCTFYNSVLPRCCTHPLPCQDAFHAASWYLPHLYCCDGSWLPVLLFESHGRAISKTVQQECLHQLSLPVARIILKFL